MTIADPIRRAAARAIALLVLSLATVACSVSRQSSVPFGSDFAPTGSTISTAPVATVGSSSVAALPLCGDAVPPAWTTAHKPGDGVPDPTGRIVFGQIARNDDIAGQVLDPLYAIDPDGSDAAQLLDCQVSRPVFSRDGRRLGLAIIMSDGSTQIATSAADGTDLRVLTSAPRSAETEKTGTPDWSPDGSWLMYAFNHTLWRVNSNGTDARLIGDPDAFDSEPRFSPDGAQIVFLRGDFTKGVSEPWIRDLASGKERRLLSNNSAELEHPSWSPDGHWIVYNTLGETSQVIERMPVDNPDATSAILYGQNGHDAFKPVYSPDGQRIVFGCDEQLCLMGADGSTAKVVLSLPNVHLNHFTWGIVPAQPLPGSSPRP